MIEIKIVDNKFTKLIFGTKSRDACICAHYLFALTRLKKKKKAS